MRRGLLSDYFEGVAVKKLSVVETDPDRSNQHEFQGSKPLRRLLGDDDRRKIPTRFIWLGEEQEGFGTDGFLSWSNVRKNKPRAPEYHLYYSGNEVTGAMKPGDHLFLAKRTDESMLVVIVPSEGTRLNQMLWLFGVSDQPDFQFEVQEIDPGVYDAELDFAARFIFDELEIEFEEPEADRLDALISKFGLKFPTTREFSELARQSNCEVAPGDDPDGALIAWMDWEEKLFRRLERHIVADRLSNGFMAGAEADVDGFLKFSLGVQNRRKARAGSALENHLEAIFRSHGLRFDRGVETENKNKPDFLFPGQKEYRDNSFSPSRLTMLGSKSTLKDRWRQVLSEAQRIQQKHLLTLEPSISENQTQEMKAKSLQLVVPKKLHETYKPLQRTWLMDLKSFISLVSDRQSPLKNSAGGALQPLQD
jgi:hypothetical protein